MSNAIVSSAHQTELREISSRVIILKRQGAAVLYELGTLLRRVQDEQLWRASGFTSFTDYLERGVDVSESSARKAVEVTRHFGPDIASAYGLEKLSRGLRYLELTGRDEKPGDLIAAELRNRGPDGRFVAVPFHEASVSQIDEAIRIELHRQRAGKHRPPDEVEDLVERIGAVLPALPKGMRSAKRRVEATKSKRGEVVFTFKQIPRAELRTFLAAVLAELGGDEETG